MTSRKRCGRFCATSRPHGRDEGRSEAPPSARSREIARARQGLEPRRHSSRVFEKRRRARRRPHATPRPRPRHGDTFDAPTSPSADPAARHWPHGGVCTICSDTISGTALREPAFSASSEITLLNVIKDITTSGSSRRTRSLSHLGMSAGRIGPPRGDNLWMVTPGGDRRSAAHDRRRRP